MTPCRLSLKKSHTCLMLGTCKKEERMCGAETVASVCVDFICRRQWRSCHLLVLRGMDGWRGKSRRESKHVVLSKVDAGKSLDMDSREWVEPTKTAVFQSTKTSVSLAVWTQKGTEWFVVVFSTKQEGPGVKSDEVGWILYSHHTAVEIFKTFLLVPGSSADIKRVIQGHASG